MAEVTVSTWPEFVSAVAVAGDTVIVPPGTVWDMNDIAPEGTPSLTIAAAHIYGNGAVIRAPRINSTFFTLADSAESIEDIRIEDFVASKPVILKSTNNECKLKNVVLAGIQTAELTLRCTRGSLTFCANQNAGCGFTIRIVGGDFMYDAAKISFTDCDFIMEGGYIGTSTAVATTLVNCNVYGRCNGVYLSSQSQLSIINAVTDVVYVYSAGRLIVANSDFCSNIHENVISVTDDQMRDPEYLSSIDFPIGVEL